MDEKNSVLVIFFLILAFRRNVFIYL